MNIGEASRQYQVALEACRTEPDDEGLQAELCQAKSALTLLWLEHTLGR